MLSNIQTQNQCFLKYIFLSSCYKNSLLSKTAYVNFIYIQQDLVINRSNNF